jgi:hypothetical protein
MSRYTCFKSPFFFGGISSPKVLNCRGKLYSAHHWAGDQYLVDTPSFALQGFVPSYYERLSDIHGMRIPTPKIQ